MGFSLAATAFLSDGVDASAEQTVPRAVSELNEMIDGKEADGEGGLGRPVDVVQNYNGALESESLPSPLVAGRGQVGAYDLTN